ncbi:MAG: hypothetical protein ACRC3B_15495, partial [Bacteroidia bacterium]
NDPEKMFNQAIDNMNFGQEFAVLYEGNHRLAYISKIGEGQYLYTAASTNKKVIFTHMVVDSKKLKRLGITVNQ